MKLSQKLLHQQFKIINKIYYIKIQIRFSGGFVWVMLLVSSRFNVVAAVTAAAAAQQHHRSATFKYSISICVLLCSLLHRL